VPAERIFGLTYATWKMAGLVLFLLAFLAVCAWAVLTRRSRFEADARLALEDGVRADTPRDEGS